MATTKPRITITLSDRQHQLLKAISEASGQSMSSSVVELLESAEPVLERLAATFQAMKSVKNQERARIAKTLDDAQTAFEPLALAAVDQLDMFLGKLESQSGVQEGMRSSRSRAADSPSDSPESSTEIPRTNRGVTPTEPKRPKPALANAPRSGSKKKVFSKTSKKTGMPTS